MGFLRTGIAPHYGADTGRALNRSQRQLAARRHDRSTKKSAHLLVSGKLAPTTSSNYYQFVSQLMTFTLLH